jgi:hypothetical protein
VPERVKRIGTVVLLDTLDDPTAIHEVVLKHSMDNALSLMIPVGSAIVDAVHVLPDSESKSESTSPWASTYDPVATQLVIERHETASNVVFVKPVGSRP